MLVYQKSPAFLVHVANKGDTQTDKQVSKSTQTMIPIKLFENSSPQLIYNSYTFSLSSFFLYFNQYNDGEIFLQES